MYLATCSGIKLARTRKPMTTLVVCIKIFKDEYIAKFCLEIPSDVLLVNTRRLQRPNITSDTSSSVISCNLIISLFARTFDLM